MINNQDQVEIVEIVNEEVVVHEEIEKEEVVNQEHLQEDVQVNLSEKNLSNEQLENDEIDSVVSKNEIKNKCMKIFINFSQFSKKDKDYYLSQQSLIKILKGVNLIDDNTLKITDIDILFKKTTSYGTRLNINQFLDFIVLVTQKIDSAAYKQDPKGAVSNIIKTFFEPFAKYLDKKSGEDSNKNIKMSSNNVLIQNSIELIIEKFQCDAKVYELINSIYFALKEIYLSYFGVELKPLEVEKILPISFQGLLDFCKDFEITNYLCSINQLVIYWNVMLKTPIEEITKNPEIPYLINEKKDLGTVFSLSKFTALLIYFSIMTFNKYKLNSNAISTAERVLFFLEKLENSVGFQNLERRTNKPHSSKLTLIPQKDLIKALNTTLNKTFRMVDGKKKSEMTEKIRNYNERSKIPGEIIDLRQLLNVIPEAYARVESKFDILKEIFLNYSRKGNKLNNNKINYSSYIKFLRDCRLVYDPKTDTLKKSDKKKNKSNNNSIVFDPTALARSPLRSFNSTVLSKTSSAKKIETVPKTLKKKVEPLKIPKGKLQENEVELIFFKLTGFNNFDNSEKIKAQFDGNPGVSLELDKKPNSMIIDQSIRVKANSFNTPHTMDFCLFIKSFELLGKKLHPERNLDQAFVIFIEKDLKRFLTENDQILNEKKKLNELLQSLKKNDTMDVIKDIHPMIYPHYENYCNTNGLLNFELLFNFYKDFQIFPEMVNLMQIKNLFFTLSDTYGRQINNAQTGPINLTKTNENNKNISSNNNEKPIQNKKNITKNENINYDLFLDSLAITANIMKNSVDYNSCDKILYLIERISHTDAARKCLLKSGKTLLSCKEYIDHAASLRIKYAGFYGKKESGKEEGKQKKFDDIFY